MQIVDRLEGIYVQHIDIIYLETLICNLSFVHLFMEIYVQTFLEALMCKLNGYIWHQNERRPFQSLKGFSITLEHKSSGARALGTLLVGQLDSRKTWFSNVLPGTRILVILMTFPMTSIKWIILGRFTKKPRDFFGFLKKNPVLSIVLAV